MKELNICAFIITLVFAGCRSNLTETDDENEKVKTPVTITHIRKSDISEQIELNASSYYLKKNIVRANCNGYIKEMFIELGQQVEQGKSLFLIRTKEADVLNKTEFQDSLYRFKGEFTMSASSSGIVTELNKLANDYITEGDPLAVIADKSSFVFLLNVPFELVKYFSPGKSCNVNLPDSTQFKGIILTKLPQVNSVSQTQSFIIKIENKNTLPENLNAVVRMIKSERQNTQVLDKSALLSDEIVQNFWVMKLINDTTAVKIPVRKGLTSEEEIEIISPVFLPDDRIILTGNYGLPDTAFVKIIDQQ
jgi:biotin carboxyl carrier protein